MILYTDAVRARFRKHEHSKTVASPVNLQGERVAAYTKVADPTYSRIHAACLSRVRHHEWWRKVRQISESEGLGLSRLLRFLLGRSLDPPVRLTRLTAGAMKNAMITEKS
jgi:hypothetical protein